MKVETRRLERVYRRYKTDITYRAWHEQSKRNRAFLQDRFTHYWTETITANSHDPKAQWSKINALLKVPTVSFSNEKHSAADFANHFQNKVEAIRVATASATPPEVEFRPCPILSTFSVVTADEVAKIIARSPSKHCSLDPAPTRLVKRLSPLLVDVIAQMCNASFAEGVFPRCLKSAVVRPRLKKPTLDPDDLNSYRPISNLSFISKVVERAVAARFNEHADVHKLLPGCQSAYRANHSTETAITAVHNSIVRAVDRGKVTALILLDLSAAFDTVDHNILLGVLENRFGLQGPVLQWYDSYLTGRTQTFQIGVTHSDAFDVDCSVPQGSVLGPLKFIAYTEDLVKLIDSHSIDTLQLYADDTQIAAHSSTDDVKHAIDRLQLCVADVHRWCQSRRLQLNPSKTEAIWFGTRASLKKIGPADLRFEIGSDIIKPASSVRDLGVILDSELTMKNHINKVVSTGFYQLRRLRQVRRIPGQQVTANLVCSFVLSRLDHCNSLFAGLHKSIIDPLQRLQNAAARLVIGTGICDHITPALPSLHWLPECRFAIVLHSNCVF